MKIEMREITVRDLAEGYVDNSVEGVRAYGGKLDVRPPYQREFVYKDEQRDKVLDTARKGFPLNVMYWAVRGDGTYEVIDGQQRTISLCQYVAGDFSIRDSRFDGPRYFSGLRQDEKDQLLGYPLTVYLCEGGASEKLEWFKTINIAAQPLKDQELRNAVYHGPWLAEARRWFSKPGCMAQARGSKYLKGSAIRQDYLEAAIDWVSVGDIDGYMARHQQDKTAVEICSQFLAVVTWLEATFPVYRPQMRGLDWGDIHRAHGDEKLDPDALEAEIASLLADDDVTRKPGVYRYVLDRDERHLNIRAFTPAMRAAAHARQDGQCASCGDVFEIGDMEADHVDPWSKGGKTAPENCQMLCKPCNRRKGGK